MENYQEAFSEFIDHVVDEELICLIGMNRKSRIYDKPYYKLYENIKEIFLKSGDDYEVLLNSAKGINQKPKTLWRCDTLIQSIPLIEFSSVFDVDTNKVYQALRVDLGIKIQSSEQEATYVNDECYRRFNALIE